MNLPDKKETIRAYYEYYDQIAGERKDKLMEIAYQRVDETEEVRTSKDGNFIKRVHETYSAIEIAHFCKNVHYEYDIDDMQGVSLGAGLFWKKIIPKVQEAITVVGCMYLYLFAADNSDYEETRSLIRYYKDDFKFDELQDLMIIKPDYDRRCQAMIQDVAEIERDEYTFWARYKKDNQMLHIIKDRVEMLRIFIRYSELLDQWLKIAAVAPDVGTFEEQITR